MSDLKKILVWTTVMSSFLVGPSVFAARYCVSTDTVQSITPSTLTVSDGGATESIPMSGIQIRAGMYPANATILQIGEKVRILAAGSSNVVIVRPAAHGKLVKTGSAWDVQTHHHGMWRLIGTNPQFLGMKTWSAGARVAAFGTSSNNSVSLTALAAHPIMTHAQVTAANANSITAKSDQYGALTYSFEGIPQHFQHYLASLPVGKAVIAYLNPLDHQVLAIMPDHMDRWAKVMEHGSAGQLVAVSPKDLTLTNALGTVTVPLNAPVTMHWEGHPQAKAQDLTPGTRILVFRSEHHPTLKIDVLNGTKS